MTTHNRSYLLARVEVDQQRGVALEGVGGGDVWREAVLMGQEVLAAVVAGDLGAGEEEGEGQGEG